MIATSLLLRIVVLVMRDSDSGKNGDLWMLDIFLEDLCGPLEVVGQPCPFHFLPTGDVQFAYESLSPIQTAQRIGFTPTKDWHYCLRRSSFLMSSHLARETVPRLRTDLKQTPPYNGLALLPTKIVG